MEEAGLVAQVSLVRSEHASEETESLSTRELRGGIVLWRVFKFYPGGRLLCVTCNR